MVSAGFRVALVSSILLGLTGVGAAQVTEVKGTVQRVDVPTGTIYFTDGRTMTLQPGSRIFVGDREVRLADVEPGWTLVTSAPTTAPGSDTAPPTIPARGHTQAPAAVDATGIVASVDPRTGLITLQDGRVVRVTPGTTVWQPVTVGSVMPGASVFVRNAEPLDFRPGTAMPSASRSYQMGTVRSYDSATQRVILSDGTIVQLRPGTQATFNGQPLPMADLRPGDEIIVGLPAGTSVAATDPAASALPRQAVGVIQGESIYVVRRVQSP
jgi:hypothetical protein